MTLNSNEILNERLHMIKNARNVITFDNRFRENWRYFIGITTSSFTYSQYTFLGGNPLFAELRRRAWTVQLTVNDAIDLLVLTGEDFHPGVHTRDTLGDRYEILRKTADQGLISIPIVLSWGLIIGEEIQEDGRSLVRNIRMPELTHYNRLTASAVLVNFYRPHGLQPTHAHASPVYPEAVLVNEGHGVHAPEFSQSAPPMFGLEGNFEVEERLPSRDKVTSVGRLLLIPIEEYEKFTVRGSRGASIKPPFFESVTFPVEQLSKRLELMRQASLRLQSYWVGNRDWVPARRRTFLSERKLAHLYPGSQPDLGETEQEPGIKRGSMIMAGNIKPGQIGLTRYDAKPIEAEWYPTYQATMDLIKWGLDDGRQTHGTTAEWQQLWPQDLLEHNGNVTGGDTEQHDGLLVDDVQANEQHISNMQQQENIYEPIFGGTFVS